MTYSTRVVLSVSLALSGVTAAQQPLDPLRATVYQEAARFADCWIRGDFRCVNELVDRERMLAAGLASDLEVLQLAVRGYSMGDDYARIAVAEPWPPFSVDGTLFTFVPYYEARWQYSGTDPRSARNESRRVDIGYMIGASDSDGESWRFIRVDPGSSLSSGSMDPVIPDYGDAPRPDVGWFGGNELPLSQSRWLETTERRFVPVDDAVAYALTFEIRRELEGPLNLTVRYEDPANPDQPLLFSGSLERGQRVLQWQSPALRGFRMGRLYDVELEGSDPDTGARLFRHREVVKFLTTLDVWMAVSKPPASFQGPGPAQ